MFYFFDFEGDKKSLLFYFYLASYRVLLGCYEKIEVSDSVPLIHFNNKMFQWIQDFIAPFYRFTKAEYKSSISKVDNLLDPTNATIISQIEAKFISYSFRDITFEIELKDKNIHQFSFTQKGIKKSFLCV